MTSDKRYGAHTGNTPDGDFEGWTVGEIAANTYTGQPSYVRELARDIIAAQARIAELGAELAAAEATIARVGAVSRDLRNLAVACKRIPERAAELNGIADELEAALAGPKDGE